MSANTSNEITAACRNSEFMGTERPALDPRVLGKVGEHRNQLLEYLSFVCTFSSVSGSRSKLEGRLGERYGQEWLTHRESQKVFWVPIAYPRPFVSNRVSGKAWLHPNPALPDHGQLEMSAFL